MKMRLSSLALVGVVALGALSAMGSPALALDPYDAPIVTCQSSNLASITLKVCGGPNTGAPAGITIQYKKLSDYQLSGWADDGTLCAISLSGQPSLQHPDKSRWELLAGECETVEIGDVNFDETGVSGNDCAYAPLECGTDYVFRVFAHAGRRMGRSDWTANVTCSTTPCESGCTLTQGYWKTHGPAGCQTGNNTNMWPVTSMKLGTVTYTAAQLCAIFNASAKGNGLISLAHQLIAAKLNLASGVLAPCVASAVTAADNLIGNQVIPPVGSASMSSSATSGLTSTLTLFNEGDNAGPCPGIDHCPSNLILKKGQERGVIVQPGQAKSWGSVKSIYR